MNNKKNIDRLFQEKLKDFEAVPSNSIWENIAEELHSNKKQRRVIPFWWKIVGVAASLFLLFSIGNIVFNNPKTMPEETIVNTNPDIEAIENTPNQNDIINLDSINSKDVAKEDALQENISDSNSVLTTQSKILNPYINRNNNIKVASNKKFNNPKKSIVHAGKLTIKGEKINKTVAKNSTVPNNLSNKSQEYSIDEVHINTTLNEASQLINKQNTITENNSENKLNNTADINPDKEEKLSLTDAIATTAEDEFLRSEKEKIDRWSVSPNVAPVYYNTLGKGSHIDDQFVNNSKTGEYNTSYGINLAYAINEKLSIRSGVHNVNLSYDTDNVILYQSLSSNTSTNLVRNSSQLKHITLSSSAQNISAISSTNLFVQESQGLFPNENAAISQRIGYYEIPVELQYGIVNKDFGVNLIGGFSTFLLNNNEVFSEFQERRNYIGKANNINNISFSANFGVGLDYKFSDNFKFNFEPTFKYQINAFNETSGNFKPYIIGVYTGFSFKF